MRSILFLAAGLTAGFVVAHLVARTPQGKAILDDIDSRMREFGEAVADGYRTREAELRAAIAGAD